MRTFTVKYVDRGRAATATVQGNEIATLDDSLCIRYDGMPIATFPKDDVLHVTSHGDNDGPPAHADEDLGMPVRVEFAVRSERRDERWPRPLTALEPIAPNEAAERLARRPPEGGRFRRRYAGGVLVGSGDSTRSSTTRS